jgi:transposase-like protein
MEEKKNKRYSGEFKVLVVEDILNNKLALHEARRKYFPHVTKESGCNFIKKWIQLYQEEGVRRLMEDRRGKGSNGRPKKAIMEEMPPEQELEYLRAENEYLKNCIALAEKKQMLRNTKK